MNALVALLQSVSAHLLSFLPALLFGLGLWLVLPRGRVAGRSVGALMVTVGLLLSFWQLPQLGSAGERLLLTFLCLLTAGASVGTITLRNPVYCALWFAMALLGTSGLYLFQGAQFLGMATIAVYAGAILVTFLFVLMLAQPKGRAFYDRLSWEAWLSAVTGTALLAVLSLMIRGLGDTAPVGGVPSASGGGVLADLHMATFGSVLFGKHLISVEVVGTLLLAALVAASAIVSHGRTLPVLPKEPLHV